MLSETVYNIYNLCFADLTALSQALQRTGCNPSLVPLLKELMEVQHSSDLSTALDK